MRFLIGFLVGIGVCIMVVFGYASVLNSQDILSGEIATEHRDVSDFDKIELSGFGNVVLSQGEKESLTILADKSQLDRIRSKVSGGALKVDIKERNIFTTLFSDLRSGIEYQIVVKDLTKLDTNGSFNVESRQLSGSQLSISSNGSSNLDLGLDVENLKIQSSGSTTLKLTGTADVQDVYFSGSGRLFGKELVGETVAIKISGSGNAEVNVSESLDVNISGSGAVRYVGEPDDIDQSISGSGKVEKLTE